MDADLTRADNYLFHAAKALNEARSQISAASGVFVENELARQTLAETLGQAHNAISRAQHDLQLHQSREQRRDDRDSAERYLSSVWFPDDGNSVLQFAILPMPLEIERIPAEVLDQRDFDRNLTAWITRFNNQERTRTGYLMAVPGGMGSRFEFDRRRFETTPQGGTRPSQQAFIYPSGAIVYWQPLWRHYDPPRFFLEMIKQDLRLTLLFAGYLYQEMGIVPRAIALQGLLRNVEDFQMLVPGYFAHAPNVMVPKPGVVSSMLPSAPLILSGTFDAMLARALPAAEASVLSSYELLTPS